ncbi:Nif3-like dinuclear metal center hexameric protein [Fastidiosibacter lacustris]|uniref:Nif3-like dinuclear metal center hexameric protein n=1 Tax=Fastidiosibacter lacustris TaxID=2056695 RepID=UPI000E342BAF|nr:Nif3-like dinuclear metal center hexameric protein [Fastidiosibacter lacustris]
MVNNKKFERYIDTLLNIQSIKDYCPNGLQIEGKKNINIIVTGVSASLELIHAAIAKKADAILVHHGYFWKAENPTITGIKYQRIKAIIQHNINLFGYHLPLDVHPNLGNNVQLAKRLDLCIVGEFNTNTIPNYGLMCETKLTLNALIDKIESTLMRKPLVVGNQNLHIHKVAICTGGAQDLIEQAYHAGADVYISGEISERTTLIARELGMTYIAAGHHATERYGIATLGQYLAQEFSLEHYFVDIDNPV